MAQADVNGMAEGGPSSPRAPPLDVEGYKAAPPELELEQVHFYVRHGERTPVRARMTEAPASLPERWTLCKTARRFKAAVSSSLNSTEDDMTPILRVLEKGNGTVGEGECLLGELTDLGRQTTYAFGQALRKLYVDRLGFLPDTVRSNEEVYFRSTNVPRTTESLHEIVHGLYPPEKRIGHYVPQLRVRTGKDENLFANTYVCKRLEMLEAGFARAAASSWNAVLEPLDAKLSKYIGGNPIRLDGSPRASGILDTIKAATAHGIPVPPEFREKAVMDLIEKAVVQEWFGGYETEEVRRLGMGRLLADISTKMDKKARLGDDDPMKILVHSTHDTTLAGICATFDVFDEKWPAFTSSVSFELFRKQVPQGQSTTGSWQTLLVPFQKPKVSDYYVRMRYQNKVLSLPICAADGKHLPGNPEFCTLAAFRDRVRELTPADWDAECARPAKGSA